jgi:outer membrane protein assembly factor BamA
LAEDQRNGSARVRALLAGSRKHALHLLEAGLVFDTRDSEIAPTSGQFHQVEARVSPWQTGFHPYRYAELNTTLRFYQPILPGLLPDRLVLALRTIGYFQIGDVPFYELSRFDETSALGGAKGVRGIPKNRYYGKRKVFGNVELRARLFNFQVSRGEYQFGLAAFFDGGRVWADVRPAVELDGTGLGLKYGAGGGLRLQKGKTFVLRADLAWSPDARPIGGYFLANHVF